ncbi:MAG: hypothetical protein WAO08_36125 [Hyphomicrobiaceae bacterium]
MTLRKTTIALGSAVVALAATSLADTASAVNFGYSRGPAYFDGGGFLYRAPQQNQNLPGAAPRPSKRDMRMAPSMGDRGMRGGSRMNGGMGRR